MSAHRDRYRQKFRNTHLEKFEIREKILAFEPKLRTLVGRAEWCLSTHHPQTIWGLGHMRFNLKKGEEGR